MLKSRNPERLRHVWFAALVVPAVLMTILGGIAHAQGRGFGGPQLSPEDANRAWRIQAIGIYRELGIDRESGRKVVEAYTAARSSYQKGLEELSNQEGGRRNFEDYRALGAKERVKLTTALTEIVGEEKAGEAIVFLGTFSRTWDTMVHTLMGFEFDREKRRPALKLINAYMADYSKAINKARESRDFASVRATMEEMKETLDTGMAEHLSEEQLVTWKEATTFRRGSRNRN